MGLLAALWSALIGFGLAAIPLLIVWMATPQSGLTWLESLHVAGLLWVAAQGAPVVLSGVTYSLMPWGLALVPLLLLGYSGGWAARRSAARTSRQVVTVVLSGSLTYAAVVAVAALVTARSTSSVAVGHAAAYGLALALLGMGWGAARAASRAGATPLPPNSLRVVVRAGLVAAATVVGIGAVAATISLTVHVDDAITMSQSLHAGFLGGLGLLALGIAYTPVMAMWGASYAMGAGVVIGPAITVSPFVAVTAPTTLPPFPLLAAIPQTASPASWLLPLSGVLAGVVAGVLIGRRARQEQRLVRLAMAGGAAAVAGFVLAAGAFLASGSLGDVRLAQLGPVPLTVGVLAAVLVVLGAAPSAVLPSPPDRPQLAVAEPPLQPAVSDPRPQPAVAEPPPQQAATDTVDDETP